MTGGQATGGLTGHIVVCGLDELGHRTIEELRRLVEDVVVIARAPGEEFAYHARQLGATLVDGSYRDESVFIRAGVPAASALVITEDDDVGNLHAALAAQDLNPRLRIGLRMFNAELGRRVLLMFGDCTVLDPSAIAAPAFVSAALHEPWEQRIDIAGRRLVVRQGSADDPDVLLPLARVHPGGSAELFPDRGDDLLCLAATEAVRRPEVTGEGRRGWRRWLGVEVAYFRGIIGAADRRLWYLAAVSSFWRH